MSADNGIYILQTKDEFRVIEAQAIENLYWWPKFCCINQEIKEDKNKEGFDIEICKYCGTKIDYEERSEINPKVLKDYFGESKVFKTREEVLDKAFRMEEEILQSECPIIEYGISWINGWEDKKFPK
jgi:hypothetical protein